MTDQYLVSEYTVSKTVIDALMTAAVKWSQDDPAGLRYFWNAGSGQVNAETATRVGQMLWHANWYKADGWEDDGDGSKSQDVLAGPVYEYEPLEGIPGPLIVLRLIDNYVYQTGGYPEEWRPSEAFGFVYALGQAAIARLVRDADLPWGVGDDARDLFLTYGEPDPPADPLDSDNPAWSEMNERLAASGLPFKAATLGERRRRVEGSGGPLLQGYWILNAPRIGMAPAQVSLYATEAEAAEGFDRDVRRASQQVAIVYVPEVLRIGRTVVFLFVCNNDQVLSEMAERARALFPKPDAYWAKSVRPPATE